MQSQPNKKKKQQSTDNSVSGSSKGKTVTKKSKADQEEAEHERKRSYIYRIILGAALALVLYFYLAPGEEEPTPNITPPGPGGEDIQSGVIDLKTYHPDVFRYTKSVKYDVDDSFSDTKVTTQIVRYIHEFMEVKLHPKIHFDTGIQYNDPHLGLKNDYDYCVKSDVYKLQHPESVLENYYILQDFSPNELPRDIAQDFGINVRPEIYMEMSRSLGSSRKLDIPLETSLINSRISRFHHFHPFGKCLFCAFQSSNHVPGKWAITGKDLVIDNYRKYTETRQFRNREQCLKTVNFMPNSYRLYDPKECRAFFNHLDSQEYKKTLEKYGIAFILKEGRDIHRGEGITLFSPDVERKYRKQYGNGANCEAMSKQVVQAQTYIANPMLYKGHKIEVRIYFLIASTNPLVIYSQNLAHLRMCGVPFDLHSTQKEVHVCNVALSKKVSNEFVVDFPLEGLHEYLTAEGKINDPLWLQKEVYPQIYRAVTHLTRMGEHDLLIDSRVNENFAIDFLLDEDSKIWFMENNPNPQILRISDARVKRHYRMFGDLFEIQFNYLRSRFRRIHALALRMKQDIQNQTFDKEKYREEFKRINKNYLEKEYELRSNNTYVKVYDENLEGEARFMGNLPEGCLEL